MMQGYYVSAAGKMSIVFTGPHALRHALNFADMARKTDMVDGVKVGVAIGKAT